MIVTSQHHPTEDTRLRPLYLPLLAMLAFTALSGCDAIQNTRYRSAIEKALHEDALTGKDPTPGHVAAMRQVDISDCPQEFRTAYMNHIHAWDEAAAVAQAKAKLDHDEDAAAFAGALASLFNSDATPWSDHLRAEQEAERLTAVASKDIASTWQEIENLAGKYGARLPQ